MYLVIDVELLDNLIKSKKKIFPVTYGGLVADSLLYILKPNHTFFSLTFI